MSTWTAYFVHASEFEEAIDAIVSGDRERIRKIEIAEEYDCEARNSNEARQKAKRYAKTYLIPGLKMLYVDERTGLFL